MAVESVLPPVSSISNNGGAFFQGSVWAGAFNGRAEYIALVTQASTGAPTVVVLFNNIGTIAWARTTAGVYTGTLGGAFTTDKTMARLSNGITSPQGIVSAERTTANVIALRSWDSTAGTPALADGILTNALLEIMVFPT